MSDWDAGRYHRLSDPQMAWGRVVLDRLRPVEGERILDVGCGSGRATAAIAARAGVVVFGLDRSAAMLREALQNASGASVFGRGSGAALPFSEAFDAVFSTATFHWISGHPRLFAEIAAVLRPQ